jgi:hypothetical protein
MMTRTRSVRIAGVLLAAILALVLPSVASAQQSSGIAGVVRDTSGLALPGVAVEAGSPALIEKVRTATTDGEGRYNIVDLRPGTYTVTFSLSGFRTVRREGVILSSGFTATINAELPVGGVEESITVTGASPLVDIRNTRSQTRLDEESLAMLPTSNKGVMNLLTLTPGVTGAADVGGTLGLYRSMGPPQYATYHGREGMKVAYDGMGVQNTAGTGNASYIINSQNVQEMALETSGITAESSSNGFSANAIPKEGSNRFLSMVTWLYSTKGLNSDNLNDEARARGIRTTERVLTFRDLGYQLGGPIRQDRLWFLASFRAEEARSTKSNLFYNATDKTPFYTPDFSRPADKHETAKLGSGRLTWQASARNKVGAFFEFQDLCRCPHEGYYAPEAAYGLRFYPQGLAQATWTSPRTNRLLLDAGFSYTFSNWPQYRAPETEREDIKITERSSGLIYNSHGAFNDALEDERWASRFSLSYVTGTHSFKTGLQYEHLVSGNTNSLDRKVGFSGEEYGYVDFIFLNQLPNSVTQFASPSRTRNYVEDIGVYAQDQWVLNRLTLNYGLRFDIFYGHIPPQSSPAGAYVPARKFDPVSAVPKWFDLNPRAGAAYDLFGNGRTALKISTGRYLNRENFGVTGGNNPFQTSISSATRSWNDLLYPIGDPRRGNFIPDCNLQTQEANGECGRGNLNFGLANPNVTRYADDLLRGFGVRGSTWDLSTEIQRQITERLSVTGGWYRTWFANFRVTDNTLVGPSDYSHYCVTAPVDARLPDGGGHQICGLYNVSFEQFGRSENLVRRQSDFGKQKQYTDFFSISFSGQVARGLQLGGGIDTGRRVTDSCFIVDSPQDLLNCRTVIAFKDQTQAKLRGSYVLPAAISVAATFQNLPGPQYTAAWNAPNSLIAPSLGRNLSSCAAPTGACNQSASVPLIVPGTEFEKRRSQVDLRVSRRFRFTEKARLQVNVDLYNALNSGALLDVNNNYSGQSWANGDQWRLPSTSIATPSGSGIVVGRLLEFGVDLQF